MLQFLRKSAVWFEIKTPFIHIFFCANIFKIVALVPGRSFNENEGCRWLAGGREESQNRSFFLRKKCRLHSRLYGNLFELLTRSKMLGTILEKVR
jgi:hypothetical protein